MSDEQITDEQKASRTQRFAEWLMRREEARAEKESSLEGLVKLNVVVSFLTLGLVGGFEAVQLGISLIPYL
tara:strand:- start:910 stop:1122 length:213 start_codon:yes stop_codon:yes gene_type:complete